MEVVILPDQDAIASVAADAIVALVGRKPDAVIGVATGNSPMPLYRTLVQRYRAGAVSFARAKAFLLDEYVGLGPGHPEAYRAVIERELVEPTDFGPDAVVGPDADAEDLLAACAAYEEAIRAAGGIDLQILGIGTDAHIAFNEPTSSLASRTRLKTLTARTRADNAKFFVNPDDVPWHVITQGIGTILDARHLVLLAMGESKAEAVANAIEGPVSAMVPASALQLHPHATFLVDEAAASRLRLQDYYRETYASKPAWQGL